MVRPQLIALVLSATFACPPMAAQTNAPPLSPRDIDDIAMLLLLEDHRRFDETTFTRTLRAPHAEVRRRAALAVARIGDARGVSLLRLAAGDRDTSVAATVVFAIGQLRDTTTVSFFDSLLGSSRTPPTLLVEAAAALGKIRTRAADASLVRFLQTASAGPRTNAAIGEALLSIGRSTFRPGVASIVRWAASPDEEIRWRATWALFRPRDPASVEHLLRLSADPSALVRSWAVRGLTQSQADSAGKRNEAATLLRAAANDADRRVRTEAIRALATHTDSASLATLVSALQSPDTWISVSAAEGLGRYRAEATVPLLIAATEADRPCAVRITAYQALQAFAPEAALRSALSLATDSVPHCRTIATQAITRALAATGANAPSQSLRDEVSAAFERIKQSRRAELGGTDALSQIAAAKAVSTWGDSTDVPRLRALAARTETAAPAVALAATNAADAIERRRVQGTGGRQGGGGRQGRPPANLAGRDLDHYRAIVRRYVVPDYEGRPRPVATWTTTRGEIAIELYAGDAPLATDDFVKTMAAGYILGTQFTRVVPDFVDQQEAIRPGNVLRDEVNRHRIVRANISWASAGLDTGNPGYTLNHTAQPHNEGDFTTLGRVIRGMDVVDRIELGDRVTCSRCPVTTGAR